MTKRVLWQSTEKAGTPPNDSVRPITPEVLVHLHIPKTGGMTLGSMIRHGFQGNQVFEIENPKQVDYTGLGLVTYQSCRQRLASLSPADLKRVRYAWGHAPFGIHSLFERPVKYLTVVRHPVDRIISWFFYLIELNQPYLRDGRPLGFEEYVESGRDINLKDYQVRVLSGSPDLEVAGATVERCHLEAAKRNISGYFLTAAPLEQMTELALFVRRVYGWPMRRLHVEHLNQTKHRPRIEDLPRRVIRRIEDCNGYDMELYEWVGKRFSVQRQLFEPELSRDRRVFGIINQSLTTAGKVLPPSVRRKIAKMIFFA